MLRKLLLSSALVVASGAAFAADLPARVAAPAPYVAAPIFTWTGFYVGLNAGAGFNQGGDRNFSEFGYAAPAVNTFGSLSSNNDTGFTGGAQVGYNMQFGSFVAGVEADINYLDRNNGGATTLVTPNATYNLAYGDSNNWFGTVRGRLGFAFDRALVYATGGLAYGGKTGGVTGSYTPAGGVLTPLTGGSNGGNKTGWALGGGVEYAFSNAWSVKLEYLHVDLGNKTVRLIDTAANTGIDINAKNKFDVVRAGVNFRF